MRLTRQLAAAAVILAVAATASARAPKPPVCREGRFVTPAGTPPLIAGAIVAAPEALVIGGATPTIAIAGHCPAVRVRIRGTRKGTRVVASWPKNACGPGKVQLTAMIDAGCHAMQGVLRVSRSRPVHFIAPRCGDGIIDTVDGEACDGAAGCDAGQECSPDCRCVARSEPPTTVSFGGDVQPIFSARCAVPLCHSGATPTQGLDLSPGRSYAAIVGRPSTERPDLKIVDPGAPATSYLEWKISGAPAGQSILGSPMPLTGGPLSAVEQAIIREWIAEGAVNDQPASTTSTTVTSTSTTVVTVTTTSTTVVEETTSTTVTSTSTTSTTTTEPPAPVSFSGDVQPIFTARCAIPLCHSGGIPTQGLDLSAGGSYAAIVGRPSTERPDLKIVAPGAPATSYLEWKISGAPAGQSIPGSPMPLTGGPLSAVEQAIIREWIAEGALNDQPTSTTSTTVTSTSTTVVTVTSTSITSTTSTEPPTSTTSTTVTSTTVTSTSTTVAAVTTTSTTEAAVTSTSTTSTTSTEPPSPTTSTTVTSTSTTVATVTTTSTTEATVTSTSTTSTTTTEPPSPTTSTTVTSTSTTTTQPPALVSFRGDIQPIFTARCALPGCHSGPIPTQGLDLSDGSSYAALVGRSSTELPTVKLIDPGSATTSYLLWKVGKAPEGQSIVGSPMPLIGGPLSLAQVATIRDWVTQGALDN